MNAHGAPVIGWDLVVIVGLICLIAAGFFSGAETGYMSVSRIRLRRLEASDDRARRLRRQLQRIDDPIMSCLIGTNLFSVLFSALMTTAFTASFGLRGGGLALIVSATLLILFGEIGPKTLYREYPERLTLASVGPLGGFMVIVAPVRALLRVYSNLLRRMLPSSVGDEGTGLDRGSLTNLLLSNSLPETEDRRFRENLDRFLELAGNDLTRIMKPVAELVTVPPGASIRTAREVAAHSGFSRLPVLPPGGRTPAGYVLVRDMIFWSDDLEEAIPETSIRSFLLVDAALSPYELFEEMHAQGHQMAMIVDRRGDALGMTTLEDLLEAVVGSIQDEFDTRNEPFVDAVTGDHGRRREDMP